MARTTLFLLACWMTCTLALELEVLNQWNLLDLDFPYDYSLLNRYRPENNVFTGLEITDNRFFIAIPNLRSGNVATLTAIPRNTPRGSSPVLQVYPSWDFQESARPNNCTGLVSVYRMRKDSCNRLWVLDSGIRTSLEDFTRICPPKIVIFDLVTDLPVRTIIFPRQALRPNSLLTNLIIDESVQGPCDNAFLYITDSAAPGIVVYDSVKDQAWRASHPAMFPDPDFSDHTVEGETFTLMDGIIGLAHSPKLATIFFQPLATDRIFSLPTSALRKGPPGELEALPVRLLGSKSSSGLPLGVNPYDDSLYFSPLSETSIASWNPVNNQQKLLAYDPARLQFPAEIRWVEQDVDGIYILSTSFQKFFRRTVNPSAVNLRIVRIPLGTRLSHGFGNNIFFK